jgi:formate dehydrogenase subunit gamma
MGLQLVLRRAMLLQSMRFMPQGSPMVERMKARQGRALMHRAIHTARISAIQTAIKYAPFANCLNRGKAKAIFFATRPQNLYVKHTKNDNVPTMTNVAEIVASYRGLEGPLLPILHEVQAAFGYVSEAAIKEIAASLNLTRAEVHGVVSFYHDFKAAPSPLKVKLCRAEACQARGAGALGLDEPQIEPIYCLGLCSVGPAAMVGDRVYARLDAPKLAALLATL